MTTINKKELIDRVARETNQTQRAVKEVIQTFLDNVIDELSRGNRVEFRGFGIFEIRERGPRQAMNPKTMKAVSIDSRRTVKFKVGQIMKQAIEDGANHNSDGSHGEKPLGMKKSASTKEYDGQYLSA